MLFGQRLLNLAPTLWRIGRRGFSTFPRPTEFANRLSVGQTDRKKMKRVRCQIYCVIGFMHMSHSEEIE